MDEVLAKLQSAYRRYYNLWDAWSQSGSCTVPANDVYVFNVIICNGFTVAIDSLMFYHRLPVLRAVTQSLERHHPAFKKWAAEQYGLALAELRRVYNSYSPLWQHWVINRYCILGEGELKLVNTLARQAFKAGGANIRSICISQQAIGRIVLKLKVNYCTFQATAVTIFFGSLFRRGCHYNLNAFFFTDIAVLDISPELKACLKKFRVQRLAAITALKAQKIAGSPRLFKLVMCTQAVLLKEELAINNEKKKGGKKTRTALKTFNNLNINLN